MLIEAGDRPPRSSQIDYTGTTSFSYFQDGTQSGEQLPGHDWQSVQQTDAATGAATQSQRSDVGLIGARQKQPGLC